MFLESSKEVLAAASLNLVKGIEIGGGDSLRDLRRLFDRENLRSKSGESPQNSGAVPSSMQVFLEWQLNVGMSREPSRS